MKLVIQRVTNANVIVEKKVVGEIEQGLVVLIGISDNDTEATVKQMVHKIVNLRIFHDENNKRQTGACCGGFRRRGAEKRGGCAS